MKQTMTDEELEEKIIEELYQIDFGNEDLNYYFQKERIEYWIEEYFANYYKKYSPRRYRYIVKDKEEKLRRKRQKKINPFFNKYLDIINPF